LLLILLHQSIVDEVTRFAQKILPLSIWLAVGEAFILSQLVV
jgi:hypothetical protein